MSKAIFLATIENKYSFPHPEATFVAGGNNVVMDFYGDSI